MVNGKGEVLLPIVACVDLAFWYGSHKSLSKLASGYLLCIFAKARTNMAISVAIRLIEVAKYPLGIEAFNPQTGMSRIQNFQ